jgi:hypothetical protein
MVISIGDDKCHFLEGDTGFNFEVKLKNNSPIIKNIKFYESN